MEYSVTLIDSQGNIVETSDSIRGFCRKHNLSVRTFRLDLQNLTAYSLLYLVKIDVMPYSVTIGLRIAHFASITAANKTVNLRFYTFRELVETNTPYLGKVYTYSDTCPFKVDN